MSGFYHRIHADRPTVVAVRQPPTLIVVTATGVHQPAAEARAADRPLTRDPRLDTVGAHE
jgi:hypothetical protein